MKLKTDTIISMNMNMIISMNINISTIGHDNIVSAHIWEHTGCHLRHLVVTEETIQHIYT